MLAHSFSVSDPPVRKPKPTANKRRDLRIIVEAAVSYAFANLGDWCLIGAYSSTIKGFSRSQAYNRAYNLRSKMELCFTEVLAYHAGAYPIQWSLDYIKATKTYELRVVVSYVPNAEYSNGISPAVDAAIDQAHELYEESKRLLAESDDEIAQRICNKPNAKGKTLKEVLDAYAFSRQQ